jgi:tetratricopeptide (TPR) repeat protein
LANSLAGQGSALVEQERHEEAIAIFDALIERFGDSEEPALRREVAFALSNKATALARLGREDEALSVHEDRVERFAEESLSLFGETADRLAGATEPQDRVELLAALHGEAIMLRELGRQDEALPVLNELIARFEGEEDAVIREAVSIARQARQELIDDA